MAYGLRRIYERLRQGGYPPLPGTNIICNSKVVQSTGLTELLLCPDAYP